MKREISVTILVVVFALHVTTFTCALQIIIKTNNTDSNNTETKTIPTRYTTLGNIPHQPVHATNISFLSVEDIDCKNENKEEGRNKTLGKIVVFYAPFEPLHACSSDPAGLISAFARWAERHGAIAAIIPPSISVSFSGGRVIGFDDSILMPVLVADPITIDMLKEAMSDIVGISLDAGTNSVMAIKMGYLIYKDAQNLKAASKKYSHALILKIHAILCALFVTLWLAIDPFDFKGVSNFPSSFIFSLQWALQTSVFVMVLRIWIHATNVRKSKGSKVLLWQTYCFDLLLLVSAFLNGFVWYIAAVPILFYLILLLVMLLCGIEIAYYGIKMIQILKKGQSRTRQRDQFTKKIGIYCVQFVVVKVVIIVILLEGPIGQIFGVCLLLLWEWIDLICTFTILFSKRKQKQKQTLVPNNSQLTPLA